MKHLKNQRFWNRVAARYAARPLKNVTAYEAMLADVASRLKDTDAVLEIGCGTGGTAIRLSAGVAQWTATDFSAEMVKIAKAKPSEGNVSSSSLTHQVPSMVARSTRYARSTFCILSTTRLGL